jgi:hypothetical protein
VGSTPATPDQLYYGDIMAITNNPHGFAPTFDIDPYHDPRLDSTLQKPVEAVQGKMITATMHVDEMQLISMDEVAMKNKVLNMLINELLSAQCIEFTKQQDVATNTITVRARIFATPDTQVRLIRNATK